MEKILTIIIPTYNMEKYLRKCLDSLIIEENMDKVEVLVINDGSKDSSSDIAHEYQDKYPNTYRVIDKENGNYGSCVNRGLKEATGKYVKILDADDYYDNKSLNVFVESLLSINVDLVITDFVSVREQDGDIRAFKLPYKENITLSYSEIEQGMLNNNIAMHTVTYKSDNLRQIHYRQTEGISYTDQEWIFMPMTTVKTAWYISMPLYNYLIGRAGQTMSADNLKKSMPQHITIVKSMLVQINTADMKYNSYLHSRIMFVLRLIYQSALFASESAGLQYLSSFDNELFEMSQQFYNDLNNEQTNDIIKFKYISNWRTSRDKASFSFYNIMYKFLKHIS